MAVHHIEFRNMLKHTTLHRAENKSTNEVYGGGRGMVVRGGKAYVMVAVEGRVRVTGQRPRAALPRTTPPMRDLNLNLIQVWRPGHQEEGMRESSLPEY